jgi:ABC-type polysaccharide/polyol phosphate export permease
MIFYRVPVTWKALWIIPLWLLLFMITFAFTTLITHFGVFVEDLMNVFTVALQLGFYLSGIFYSIETRILPKNTIVGNLLIHCNPIALIMTDMRNVLLYNKEPHYISLLIWTVVSVVVAAFGVRTIYKHENTYVKII